MKFSSRLAIKNLTIVGAGQMGAGIAQVGAVTGHQVVLNDISEKTLARAQSGIEKSLKRMTKKMSAEDADAFMTNTLSNLSMTTDLAASVSNCDLMVEAVIEDLKLKQKLFVEMENNAPAHAILSTNTSSLPITEICVNMQDKSRFGGLHFFNPVPVMKLLEVIKCEETSQENFEKMVAWGATMKKTTVRCIDTPGFIVNRLLIPYMMEAVRLFERGHADMRDIDTAMKLGAGLPMGPFELLDYVGLDTAKFVAEGWSQTYPDEPLFRPSPTIAALVADGKLGRKTGEGFYKY